MTLAWTLTGPTDVMDAVKAFANRGRSVAAELVLGARHVRRVLQTPQSGRRLE